MGVVVYNPGPEDWGQPGLKQKQNNNKKGNIFLIEKNY